MSVAPAQDATTLFDVGLNRVQRALRGPGLWIDIAAAVVHVRSDCPCFAAQLRAAYPCFPFADRGDWADVHLQLQRARGPRRWIRPQVVLSCDGQQPFEPFAADSPLPLFEWGCNWMLGHRLNHLLLLHAGVVERDGFALVLPATPGSGKSTLTAALAQSGWRLLSDEFGAFDPEAGAFRAMLKPVALKNQSIEIMRAFAPQAVFGPEFPETRKGRVAHMAANALAVERRHETARPGAIVLPQWRAGAALSWEPLSANLAFPALAFNAFNYSVLGETGFRAAVRLVRECLAWRLNYSDLGDALAALDAAWPQVVHRHRGGES